MNSYAAFRACTLQAQLQMMNHSRYTTLANSTETKNKLPPSRVAMLGDLLSKTPHELNNCQVKSCSKQKNVKRNPGSPEFVQVIVFFALIPA